MKKLIAVSSMLLAVSSCAVGGGTRGVASEIEYNAKLCFSNDRDFSGDQSYCSKIDKVEMTPTSIIITDKSDKTCRIPDSVMPVADLNELKKSLESGSANDVVCVTSSRHIHTDKNQRNVMYMAIDFNLHAE